MDHHNNRQHGHRYVYQYNPPTQSQNEPEVSNEKEVQDEHDEKIEDNQQT